MISNQDLTRWLEAYGAAWEGRDAGAAAALFTDDAQYQETPYAEPFVGRGGVSDYWSRVTAGQRDVSFQFEPIAVSGSTGIAQWSAKFRSVSGDANSGDANSDGANSDGVKVELNGVFVLEFADQAHVRSLREWWHVRSE